MSDPTTDTTAPSQDLPLWQLQALADAVPAPWRNGGGTTRELAALPSAADWHWRISVAEVTAAGPFSAFDGVDRCFAVLGGGGVSLDVDGVPHRVAARGEALAFDGGARTGCELLDGPTRDLNLMVRRVDGGGPGASGARMARVAGEARFSPAGAAVVALYTADGAAEIIGEGGAMTVPPHTLAWRSLPAGATLQIRAVDALWMEIPA